MILRISGKHFEAEACARSTKLPVCNVYKRGQLGPLKKRSKTAGVNIVLLRTRSFNQNLYGLVNRVSKVVAMSRPELCRLRSFRGVEHMCLDFAINELDVAGQFEQIPYEFLRDLGQLRIDLEISIYHAFKGKRKSLNLCRLCGRPIP